jgi:hypothetical protein
MKNRAVVLVLAILFVLPLASRIIARDADRNDVATMQAELKKLRQEQVDAAVRTKKACESAWDAGTIVTETYLDAIEALADARLAAADSHEMRARALEEPVNTLRQMDAHLRDHCEIQAYARELVSLRLKSAEIVLLEEKLRTAHADGKP